MLSLLLAIQQHLLAGVAAGGPLAGRRFPALLLQCIPRSLVLGLPRRIAPAKDIPSYHPPFGHSDAL